jgi:Nif-specific regulatory protein
VALISDSSSFEVRGIVSRESYALAGGYDTSPTPRRTSDVAEEVSAGTTLAEGFERAMRVFDERTGAPRAALMLVDPGARLLAVEAAYGMQRDALRPRFGAGVSGRVADSGKPIVVPVVRCEPMALSELSDPSAWPAERLSLVSVPLVVGRRCVGALSIYFLHDASAPIRTRLGAVQNMATALASRLLADHGAAVEATPRTASRAQFEYANMVGDSAPMRQVYEEIGQVAPTSATALVLGESGTGKELVAQAIHANSDRAAGPFVKINSAAFPEALFEAELFGYERGAFTGAVGRKKGRLDLAQGGTLFLDEIGDLPLPTQVKLLRVLQSREYERLGGTETLKADVRLVAATNKDLVAAVANGTFREDLYYRLNVFTITLPPLRDRRSDLPALADYFLEKYAREHRRDIRRIASGALDVLLAHSWPGNVREFENAIERAVVSCTGPVLDESHLPKSIRGAGQPSQPPPTTLAEAVTQLERQMIADALRETQGNLARASRRLGTTERILGYKVRKYGLRSLFARSRP